MSGKFPTAGSSPQVPNAPTPPGVRAPATPTHLSNAGYRVADGPSYDLTPSAANAWDVAKQTFGPSLDYEVTQRQLSAFLPRVPHKFQELFAYSDLLNDGPTLSLLIGLARDTTPADQTKAEAIAREFLGTPAHLVDREIEKLMPELPPMLRRGIVECGLLKDHDCRVLLYAVARAALPVIRERAGMSLGELQQQAADRANMKAPPADMAHVDAELDRLNKLMKTNRKAYDREESYYRDLLRRKHGG